MTDIIISFQWKDYAIAVFSIDSDDGFVFSAVNYCGEEYNEKMSSREECELFNFTIKKLKEMDAP